MYNLFCAFLNTALAVSLLVLVILPLRPILDRHYHAKGRLHIWFGLAICLINTISMSSTNTRFGTDVPTAIHLVVPYARLVWTDGSLLPHWTTRPLLPSDLAANLLAALPADFAGDTDTLELATRATFDVQVLTVLIWVWLAGVVTVLGYHLLRHFLFRYQVLRWSLPVQNQALLDTVTAIQETLRQVAETETEVISNPMEKTIRVLRCDWVSGPMILGKRRPLLIFPREDYSSEEAYYICLHELTHLKNQDLGNRFWYLLLNALYWFAPPIWALRRAAYRDMELACDESVLADATREEKAQYCRTLLDTVPHSGGKTTVLTTYFRGDGPSLRERLHNIWYEGKPRKSGRLLYFLIVAPILLLCCFGVSVTYAQGLPPEEIQLINQYQVGTGAPEDTVCLTDANFWDRNHSQWLDVYFDSLLHLPDGHPLRLLDYTVNRTAVAAVESRYVPDDRPHTILMANITLTPAEPDSPWFAQQRKDTEAPPGTVTLQILYELVYEKDGSYLVCVAHAPRETKKWQDRSLLYPDYEEKSHVYFGINWG